MPARVLVIDDTGFEKVISDALFRADFGANEVTVVPCLADGAEALWRLCWERPSRLPHLVVLTSRFKSGSSGYPLLRFMHQHPRLQRIGVVVCSSQAALTERRFARQRGAQYCLNRSATVPEIAQVLAHVVRLGTYRLHEG